MKTKETLKTHNDYLNDKVDGVRQKSKRELAFEWWNGLTSFQKSYFKDLYYESNRNLITLTRKEIEEIWNEEMHREEFILEDKLFGGENSNYKPNQKQYSQEEVDRLLDQQTARTTAQVLKSNQKQFKEANESLMSAYLDKFDDEGKMKFFKVLTDKFSKEDKVKALNILVCSISTIDIKFNSLLNQISDYK